MKPLKIDFAASLVSALDVYDGKSVSVRQFSRKNNEKVKIVACLDQITEVPYALREVQNKHKYKLRAFVQQDGFDYSRGVLDVTLRTMWDSNGTAIDALLVNNSVNKRLKPTVQVSLVNGLYRFGALSELACRKESCNW